VKKTAVTDRRFSATVAGKIGIDCHEVLQANAVEKVLGQGCLGECNLLGDLGGCEMRWV
jgi:hypothetical protein